MEKLILRALEPEDLDFLFALENDQTLWEYSDTQTPFSKETLKAYLRNAHQDIYTAKQQRYIVCNAQDASPIGCVDLYDFNPIHRRAGVGLVILEEFRNKGIGKVLLQLIEETAFNTLQLHQLYADVGSENEASIRLFQSMGYERVGVKKDWNYNRLAYHDVVVFQKINHV